MKKVVKLNQRELHRMISESVKIVLNEYGGFKQDPLNDWPMVNTSDDGNDLYKVGLWWGSGYSLDCYMVWASSEEDALAKVVAYNENETNALYDIDYWAEDCLKRIMKEQHCSIEEAKEMPEFERTYIYIDATMEGAESPHYILSENLTIEKVPEDWKQKFLEKEQKYKISSWGTNTIQESVRRTLRKYLR